MLSSAIEGFVALAGHQREGIEREPWSDAPRQVLTDDARTESRDVIADVPRCLEAPEHKSLPELTR
jgi:hypothetical protein